MDSLSRSLRKNRVTLLITFIISAVYLLAALELVSTPKPPAIFNPGPGTIFAQPDEATRAEGFVQITTFWFAAILITIAWHIWRFSREHRVFMEIVLFASVASVMATFVFLFGALVGTRELSLFLTAPLNYAFAIIVAGGGLFVFLLTLNAYLAYIARWSVVVYFLLAVPAVALYTLVLFTYLAFTTFCC